VCERMQCATSVCLKGMCATSVCLKGILWVWMHSTPYPLQRPIIQHSRACTEILVNIVFVCEGMRTRMHAHMYVHARSTAIARGSITIIVCVCWVYWCVYTSLCAYVGYTYVYIHYCVSSYM